MRVATQLWASPDWRERLEVAGLAEVAAWFADERVKVWRDIRERQNATLDLHDGTRLHVKRLRPPHGRELAAEVNGIRLLESAGIATVPLVAWGVSDDGGGVLVTRDLKGFTPADALLEGGRPFADLLALTADVAARLHGAGLHHRDLYPCHFLLDDAGDVRLIDAARVQKLPRLTRRRWVVKDLAQFRYGASRAGVATADLDAWLVRWSGGVGKSRMRWLRMSVVRKARRIAKHDDRLRDREPGRDVSLRTADATGRGA